MLATCLMVSVPLRTAHAEDTLEQQIREVVRLYEALEYEQALEQLQRARQVAHGPEENATVFLYEGIVRAELWQWAEARAAFREALLLSSEAKLPLRVSWKVTRELEAQRVSVRQELARRSTGGPAMAGQVAATEPPLLELPPPPRPAVPAPELLPAVTGQSVASGGHVKGPVRGVPVVTLGILGAGVVAGGLGAVFGLASNRLEEQARTAENHVQFVKYQGMAQRDATRANVFFGTAGVAAAGALVTWLLTPRTAVGAGSSMEVAR